MFAWFCVWLLVFVVIGCCLYHNLFAVWLFVDCPWCVCIVVFEMAFYWLVWSMLLRDDLLVHTITMCLCDWMPVGCDVAVCLIRLALAIASNFITSPYRMVYIGFLMLWMQQKVYVKDEEEQAVELDVYNQGMLKWAVQQMATNWRMFRNIAHGIAELRIVICHPRYKLRSVAWSCTTSLALMATATTSATLSLRRWRMRNSNSLQPMSCR